MSTNEVRSDDATSDASVAKVDMKLGGRHPRLGCRPRKGVLRKPRGGRSTPTSTTVTTSA